MKLWWSWRRAAAPRHTIDERFTDLADTISAGAGRWQATAVSLGLMGAWIALGPVMHYSDSWQLLANTPTTWVELFLGLFMLAAANRVEKRNYDLHQMMYRLLQRLDEEVTLEEGEIRELRDMLRAKREAPESAP